jgi:hypothetical protein
MAIAVAFVATLLAAVGIAVVIDACLVPVRFIAGRVAAAVRVLWAWISPPQV